ncbi:retrovirus-related pol polyprotein from transposon TNT 1-94, partial [Tanacetum coccineum]
LEAHGAEVSTENANHKFLRSLPLAWSNLAMTMRTKPDVGTLSIDDLKSNTNKVKYGFTSTCNTCTPSTSSTNTPEIEAFADEVIYSLFTKQSKEWDLLHEDLEQIDDLDIEKMDINWQIAMIAIRIKKFYKKIGRRVHVDGKAPVGFNKKKLECFNCHNTGHFARECITKGTHDEKNKRDSFYQHQEAGKQEKNQIGLLTMDDGIVNLGEHTKDEETNHALMAISSSSEIIIMILLELPMNILLIQILRLNEGHLLSLCHTQKTPRQPIKDQETPKVNRKNWNAMMERELGEGYSFTKKKCFVCGSLSHLIKDCDYYEKKMARDAEVKKQRVCNTGRTNINSIMPRVNNVNTNVNTVRSRQPVPTRTSNSFSPKRPQGSVVKTSAGYNWRNSKLNSNCDSGLTFIRTVNAKGPQGRPKPVKASAHWTWYKDQLEDFKESNGGSVTFGGSQWPYILILLKVLDITVTPKTSISLLEEESDKLEFTGVRQVKNILMLWLNTQPSSIHNSSTIYIFTTRKSPPPITAPIPASTPTSIPETDLEPMEHTFEEPSLAYQHFSSTRGMHWQMTVDDLLSISSSIMTGEESWKVASQSQISIDKGRRYKRRKETKGKKVVTSLDFQKKLVLGMLKELILAKERKSLYSLKKLLRRLRNNSTGGKASLTDKLSDWILWRKKKRLKNEENESETSKDVDPISGKEGVYQIVREDGTDIVYINFGAMLKDITRDDLTELYRIVMNRYGMNGPEDELEKELTPGSDENSWNTYMIIADMRVAEKVSGFRLPKATLKALKRVFLVSQRNHFNGVFSYRNDTVCAHKRPMQMLDHADIMADLNFPANDAPMEQAPTIASPTRTDDHILPLSKWVPIGKSNCVLDVHSLSRSYLPIVVGLLKNTNSLGFTASSTILAITIQQFWEPCGIIHRSNIDYAERIWEEFVQSIQTFLTDKKNLATAACGKKKTTHLLIPSVRFIGMDGREIFGMLIPDAPLTDEIKGAPYYGDYKEHVAKYQQFLDAERGKTEERENKVSMLPRSLNPRKLRSDSQQALELSLKEQAEQTQGQAHPVVLREPDSGKYQPLPEVQGKGKEKVVDEQAAHDLLTLQTPMKKSPVDQFIFQRRPPMHTEPTGHAESLSLDVELPLTDSVTESDEEVPVINAGDQENLKLPTEDQVILEEPASSTGTLSSLQNLDKDLSFTDQFFVEKPHEGSGKANAEIEVQSMVSVPIHQDTSSVPPYATSVIDLTTMQSDSLLPTSIATTSIITTTTSLPPPPQP